MRPNEAGIRLPELNRQVIQLERGFYMRTMLFAIIALLLLGTPAQGQLAAQAPSLIWVATGTDATAPLAPMLPAPGAVQQGGIPSWLTWGLVGGAGFALAVAATHGAGGGTPDTSRGSAMLFAGATGLALVGGGVAFYQWVCAPGSRSRRSGLCGR